MKRLALLCACLSLLLPMMALAQDNPDYEEFVSEDELLVFAYPADYFVAESEALPGATIASTEALLEQSANGEEIVYQSGDVILALILLPVDILSLLGVTMPEDASPEEQVSIFAEAIFSASTTPNSNLSFGEVESIEVDEELTLGFIPVSDADQNSEGSLTVYELPDNEGVFVLMVFSTYTGEYTEELQDFLLAIPKDLSYSGTAEDLLNTLMGQ